MSSWELRTVRVLFLWCVAAASPGCERGPTGPPTGPATIEVAPDSALLFPPGGTVQLVAVVRDHDGREIEDAPVEWSSADFTVATVDITGEVTALEEGTTTVTARHDTLAVGAKIVVRDPDRHALTALYRATGGENWHRNANWLNRDPVYTWYGVEVDERGRVFKLDLRSNGLAGEIPHEIGELSELGHLNLSYNALTGPIPSSISGLKGLLDLVLSGNELTGPLPARIGEAYALDLLVVEENPLAGLLPESLTQLRPHYLFFRETRLCAPRGAGFQRWLNAIRGVESSSCDASRHDRLVLTALYLAMGGPGWTEQDGWLTDADLEDWAGVSVDDSGRVTTLDLKDNNAIWMLPYQLVHLRELTRLDVSGNGKLGGTVQEWMTELDLDTLHFADTGVCAPPLEKIADWLDEMTDWSGNVCEGADSILVKLPVVYLTQPVQNRDAEVPLMAGRDALLRVFAVADSVNYFDSEARATFYKDGKSVHVANMTVKGRRGIPLEIDEGRLATSHHASIPGEVLEPGLKLVVELDPDRKLPLRDGSRRRVPESGMLALDVREMPEFKVTIVPIQIEGEDTAYANAASRMTAMSRPVREMLKMLPISDYDFSVRETFHLDYDSNLMRKLDLLRKADGDPGYYAGIFPSQNAGQLGGRTSISNTGRLTLAHEVGHNMNLLHAPCGNPRHLDPDYPHEGGRTGAWGRDRETGKLKSPNNPDLMSYCYHDTYYWISDYHHAKALEYRIEREEEKRRSAADRRPSLVLWGSTGPGQVTLDPAIVLDAAPSLPEAGGPYRIEGRSDSGGTLFSLSFNPMIESESGEGHFVFLLPVEANWAESLATITLSGPNGSDRLDATTRRPMAIVTDRATGRIRRLLDDFETAPVAGPGEVVTVSRGLPDEK